MKEIFNSFCYLESTYNIHKKVFSILSSMVGKGLTVPKTRNILFLPVLRTFHIHVVITHRTTSNYRLYIHIRIATQINASQNLSNLETFGLSSGSSHTSSSILLASESRSTSSVGMSHGSFL